MKVMRSVPFELSEDARKQTIQNLQSWLPGLIALALRLKQAHWNLRGARFKSVHEQLDEILVDVRNAVDDVAERIVTIGGAADGLPPTVAEFGGLSGFPEGLLKVDQAVTTICDDIAGIVNHGRNCVERLGEIDPISEDLAIEVVGTLEKHHWMLHSQLEP